MKVLADELALKLTIAARLRQIAERDASVQPGPEKWSHKETIGHLIDSAANNHQRFVRLQMQEHLELEGYDGDGWVGVQQYQQQAWLELIDLWESYNRHLVHVIQAMNPDALKHTWRSPEGEIVDLEFIVRDYIVHMQHHLNQIL